MKKMSLVTRILSLVMVFCMMFVMTATVAFAEEIEEPAAEREAFDLVPDEEPDRGSDSGDGEEDSPRSVGDTLDLDSVSFTNSGTAYLTLSSGNWSANFLATVVGNAGAMYEVELTIPSGTTYYYNVTSTSTTSFWLLDTFFYASPGTYTVKFRRASGSAVNVIGIAKLCD